MKKWGWVALALVGLGGWITLGRWGLEALKAHQDALQEAVQTHPVGALAVYTGVYACMVALSIPGGPVMTLTGGFLFGPYAGAVGTVLARTLGACVPFGLAKGFLAQPLRAKAGPWLGRLSAGFKKHAGFYILALRLIPVAPFFVVNVVAGLMHVPLPVYVLSTFIGILPGTFVYTMVGSGLAQTLEPEGAKLKPLMPPELFWGLMALGCLSLLPVMWKRLKKNA